MEHNTDNGVCRVLTLPYYQRIQMYVTWKQRSEVNHLAIYLGKRVYLWWYQSRIEGLHEFIVKLILFHPLRKNVAFGYFEFQLSRYVVLGMCH